MTTGKKSNKKAPIWRPHGKAIKLCGKFPTRTQKRAKA